MGAANVAQFAGIGLGPVLWGVWRDVAGSYAPVLRAVAAAAAPLAAACALLRPPVVPAAATDARWSAAEA